MPAREERLRVFCAVEMPDALKTAVGDYIRILRESFPRVRASWERAEKLHVTVKFLGDIEESKVDSLCRAAARAASAFTPFKVSVEGQGAFPPRGAPRVLWLGFGEGADVFKTLQKRLDEECSLEGFKREARDFHPHLTIARIRSAEGARALADFHRQAEFTAAPFLVDEIVVMRSELNPGGARHTPLSRHRLELTRA